jgi:hypothetical protein
MVQLRFFGQVIANIISQASGSAFDRDQEECRGLRIRHTLPPMPQDPTSNGCLHVGLTARESANQIVDVDHFRNC